MAGRRGSAKPLSSTFLLSTSERERENPLVAEPKSEEPARRAGRVGVCDCASPGSCLVRPHSHPNRYGFLTRSPETGGHHVDLGGIRAARGRLHMAHRGKVALQRRQQIFFGASAQHLCEERAARSEDIGSEGVSRFSQTHYPQVIGWRMAGRWRSHIAHHQIRWAAQHGTDALRRSASRKSNCRISAPANGCIGDRSTAMS